MTQQRELLWGKVLQRSLENHPKQGIAGPRPVWSWRQRDKMSTSWLLCLPGPNGLSSPQFGEAFANILCLPSPACIDRIGEKIGKSRVDMYGDRLCTETCLSGGHQTRRHDQIKLELNNICIWAGLEAECEPYGMFGHLIPQQPLNQTNLKTGFQFPNTICQWNTREQSRRCQNSKLWRSLLVQGRRQRGG